jgi:gamma-polyglutamate biosynthesis protein CapA
MKKTSAVVVPILSIVIVLLFILLVVSYVIDGFPAGVVTGPRRYSSAIGQLIDKAEAPNPGTVLVAGDVMLTRGVETRVRQYGAGDPEFTWKYLAPTARAANIFFFNHEGAMSDIGTDGGKAYSFRFKTNQITGMQFTGVDVVSLANNHALDWGRDALCDTRNRLVDGGVSVVGAGCNSDQAVAPAFFDMPDGTRIAFIGFSEFDQYGVATDTKSGVAKWDREIMKAAIAGAQSEADLVFVSLHWGTEYKTTPNPSQVDLAHFLIDSGADVIVGHHPHVVQPTERYNDGYIIYSLGNLVFDQYFSPETMRGLMVQFEILDKKIQSITEIPVQMTQYYQPYLSDSPPTDIEIRPAKPAGIKP